MTQLRAPTLPGLALGLLCTCLLSTCLLSQNALAGPIFTTLLSPDNEVMNDGSPAIPPGTTPADGSAWIEFTDELDAFDFEIVLNQIETPLLQAHIHIAPPTANGPIVALLFNLCDLPACAPGQVEVSGDNVVIRGSVSEIVSNAAGIGSIDEIIDSIRSNSAYINIHTQGFPAGELRGNLVPEPSTALFLGMGLILLAVKRPSSKPSTGIQTRTCELA